MSAIITLSRELTHNSKVVGSNLSPAINKFKELRQLP